MASAMLSMAAVRPVAQVRAVSARRPIEPRPPRDIFASPLRDPSSSRDAVDDSLTIPSLAPHLDASRFRPAPAKFPSRVAPPR